MTWIDSPGLLPISLGEWCWTGVVTPDPELLMELIEAGYKFDICCANPYPLNVINEAWVWNDVHIL